MNFCKKPETSETSKVFIRRKKVYVDRLTWAVQRDSCTLMVWNAYTEQYLPGFLWPIILLCLVLSPCLVYLIPPRCVCMHLLAKMDSSEKDYGWSLVKRPIYLLPHFHCSGRGGCSFPTSKRFSSTCQVSYNSVQPWHYLPGNSLRFHRWRVQSYNFKCKSQA